MTHLLRCTLLAVASLGVHCRPTDECDAGVTRCLGNVAQICDAGGAFRELADCDQVSEQSGAPFLCAFVEDDADEGVYGHTCVPAEDGTNPDAGAR